MSAIRTQIRENIVAALAAVVGLRPADGVEVCSVAYPTDVLYKPGDRVLGVARIGGDVANDGDAPLESPGSQMRTLVFTLAMKVDSPLDNAETVSAAEELIELAAAAIQLANVGIAATATVRLRAGKEEVVPHPSRVNGEGGGPVALIHYFTTTEFQL